MTAKAKILVVEDEMPVARAMAALLRRAGCETQVARNGAEAIQMVQNCPPDLITLDVDLPDACGLDLCHRLKESPCSQIPIVIVSGRQDIERGLEAGAADYITKPFDSADFVRRILSHAKLKKNEVRQWR